MSTRMFETVVGDAGSPEFRWIFGRLCARFLTHLVQWGSEPDLEDGAPMTTPPPDAPDRDRPRSGDGL